MKSRIWGLILLSLGVMALLQSTHVYFFGLAVWPVLLVLLGILIFWEVGRSWIGLGLALWVGGIGLSQILLKAEVINFGANDVFRLGWPILLVAIGLSLVFGRSKGRHIFFGGLKGWSGEAYRIGDLYHGRQPWVLDKDLDINHGIGDVVIDLTTAHLSEGTCKITVNVKIGELLIRVPGNVNVSADASVGIGELQVFGEERSGIFKLNMQKDIKVSGSNINLVIEAGLGIGELQIVQLPANNGGAQ